MKHGLILFILLLGLAAPAHADIFSASVIRVVDGDSFKFNAHILNVSVLGTCRMRLYNAPEPRGKHKEQGRAATRTLSELILNKEVTVKAAKKDKYGRWLCEVWLSDGTSVTDTMREMLKDFPELDKYSALY